MSCAFSADLDHRMLMLRVAVAGIIVAAALSSPAHAADDVPLLEPGLHTLTFERRDQPAVSYTLSVPEEYNRSTRVPLVLALHFGVGRGSSLNAGYDLLRFLIAPALADLGAVMIAPDVPTPGQWSAPRNEAAVLALLDALMRTYAVDTKKVLVTGFSMGGMGTWHFAAKYPERFTAAIPIAGRPPTNAGDWRMPVIAVHSRRDEVVPIGPTEARIARLKQAGVVADLIALDGPTHFQTPAYVDAVKQAAAQVRGLWAR